MYIESWIWLICPLMFFGMMLLCVIFRRRRRGWFCCSPFYERDTREERIGRLEEEIKRLKGER